MKNILTILFISLVLGWQLLRPGYIAMHDDLQVMRLFEMNRCFENGQVPCRWVSDLGQNYGQPLFNYYSALPYYLGEAFHLVGFTFVDTVKLLFLLSLFLSGIFVFLLAREFLRDRAALIAAIAYLAVPYHAVDIFVRGALSESWGLALVPLVLYSLIRTCRRPKTTNALLLALSLAALLITHNITTLISAPLILAFGLFYFLFGADRKKQVTFLVPAVLLGIGLSAFFLLPVLFEQSFIQTKFLVSDYFDFRAHFATISQLFTKLSWGYGPSRFNSYQYPETLSFFIGILPALSLVFTPLALYWNRGKKQRLFFFLLLYSLCLMFLFMTHSRSVFIWESVKTLEFVQFPWRFLGPVALLSSLLIGFCFESINTNEKNQQKIGAFIVAFLISANFSYYRFEKYFPKMTDTVKLTGAEYDKGIKGALLDYLPTSAKAIPSAKAPSLPQIKRGQVDINYFDKRSNYFASEFDVSSGEAEVTFPVMTFPGWTVYQNRRGTPINFDTNNDYGLITVKLGKGHQLVQAFFEDTPTRFISNIITLVSAFIMTIWFVVVSQKDDEG